MKRKILRVTFMIILFLGVLRAVYPWREQTHKLQLTWQALNLLERMDKGKLYSEIWQTFREYIEQGAWDEDFPCTVIKSEARANIRANNHYRQAVSGHSLLDSPIVGLGDPDVDTLSWAKSNPRFSAVEEFSGGAEWEGFKKWKWTAVDVMGGNMSWEQAINRYGYAQSSKELAYYTLGFILHLLQDMGCPEHVHDDPHGASGYSGFEMWVYENYMGGEAIGPNIKHLSPKKFESIDDFFINLSKIGYSIDRFHGREISRIGPPFDNSSDLARMFRIEWNPVESEWRLYNRNGVDMVWGDFAWNEYKYRENPLWTKGHDNGEWWPTFMEILNDGESLKSDERGYYYIELSGDLPPVDRERKLFPDHFLPTPLPEVADQCQGWRKENTRGRHLYSLIGRTILPYIIEHSTGLIELYHSIVNHPPYVQKVEVYQGDALLYSGFWEDKEEIKSSADTVSDVVERSLKKKTESAFTPGEIMMTITFNEPIKEIDVKLGNIPVSGSFNEDETIWSGQSAIPDSGPMEEVRGISIAALDKDSHFDNKGERLDANPSTPARRRISSDEYSWKDYEEGEDLNHKILVKRVEQKKSEEIPGSADAILGVWSWTHSWGTCVVEFFKTGPKEYAGRVLNKTLSICFENEDLFYKIKYLGDGRYQGLTPTRNISGGQWKDVTLTILGENVLEEVTTGPFMEVMRNIWKRVR